MKCTTPEPGAEMIPNLQELVAVQLTLRGRRGRSPQSFRRIAAELNAAEHRTQTGRSWHRRASERYGKAVHAI